MVYGERGGLSLDLSFDSLLELLVVFTFKYLPIVLVVISIGIARTQKRRKELKQVQDYESYKNMFTLQHIFQVYICV